MNPKEQTEVERLRLENAALRAQLKPQFALTPYGMMPVSIASMERLSASITGLTKRLALTEAQTLNVNAMFEFRDAFVAAAQRVPVKRVEYQDDGSLTVVLDYWPGPSRQTVSSMKCGCAGKGFEFCGCPPSVERRPSDMLDMLRVPDMDNVHCPGCDFATQALVIRSLRYDRICQRCGEHRASEFRPRPKKEGGE